MFGFLKKVAKIAGAPIKFTAKIAIAPVKLTGKVTGQIAKQAGKIPIVGKPLKAAINLGNAPVSLINHVASGERIDHAVLNNIKSQVKSVKEIAPYAKMCVTLIPGVGTAVGAAIAAGGALVSGQPITDALVAGVKGAIPGGPLAQSGFSLASDVVSGKKININTMINALPLDATQKKALSTTVNLSRDLASGKKINKIVLEQAQKQLPADVQKAINIGTAIGFAKTHQKKAVTKVSPFAPPKKVSGPSGIVAPKRNIKFSNKFVGGGPSSSGNTEIDKLYRIGMQTINVQAVLKAGYNVLKTPDDKRGYAIGIGLMNHKVTEPEVSKVHSQVPKQQQNGFNIALAARVGIATSKGTGSNEKQFGQAVAHGVSGGTTKLKTQAVVALGGNADAKAGVIEIAKKKGWWHRVLVALHLIKETT